MTRYTEGLANRLRTAVQRGRSLDAVGLFVASVRSGLRASDFAQGLPGRRRRTRRDPVGLRAERSLTLVNEVAHELDLHLTAVLRAA